MLSRFSPPFEMLSRFWPAERFFRSDRSELFGGIQRRVDHIWQVPVLRKAERDAQAAGQRKEVTLVDAEGKPVDPNGNGLEVIWEMDQELAEDGFNPLGNPDEAEADEPPTPPGYNPFDHPVKP
jgi:hypothetical protein